MTLTLVAGVAVLAVPGISDQFKKAAAPKFARKLELTMRQVAAEARSRGQTFVLFIWANSFSYSEGAGPRSELNIAPKGVTLISSNNRSTITFYGSGVTTPVTITVEDSETRCLVTLSLRGRVNRICK